MNKPIGIFDSGVGGLTVLKELLHYLPHETFVYFGDTARLPYGTKSKETVVRFSEENCTFLQTQDVKAIVMACHTASSWALKELRNQLSIPVIGVIEPGAVRAMNVVKERIGVIGTKSSIASRAYSNLIHSMNKEIKVFNQPCPLFVPFIEEGWTEGPILNQVIEQYMVPLLDYQVDTLILGCTHYPIIAPVIQRFIPEDISVVNPAEDTAKSLQKLLQSEGLENMANVPVNRVQYFVSDAPEHFQALGEAFLGQEIPLVNKIGEDVKVA